VGRGEEWERSGGTKNSDVVACEGLVSPCVGLAVMEVGRKSWRWEWGCWSAGGALCVC
jgi:hypothetical protein